MRHLTIGIPDQLYASFVELFKHIAEVTIAEEEIVLTEKQKKILDQRRKATKEEDFIPWKDAKKQLKFKVK